VTGKPVVSIVLPTFNGSRYLADSIGSCLAQTYQHWELIVVDDCSSDDTPAIIDRYVAVDPRIRALRHLTNRKLPAALNTGFSKARGDYFTWTSDDNVYLPNALSEMLGVLEKRRDVDVVYADVTYIDETGAAIRSAPAGACEERLPQFRGRMLLFRRRI
jgi:glycosyltransferase involved in cell wall biosynthesis